MSNDGRAPEFGALDLERRPAATEVRSTLVLASMQALRTHGVYDRYLTTLDAAARDRLVALVAGVWLPVSVALLHYEACEALRLPMSQQLRMGSDVGARVQGTFLGVAVRAANGYMDRLWNRVFAGGGGVRLTKVGPKDARVDLIGLPLLDVPYFRHAYRGTFQGAIELLCTKAYVQELPAPTPRGSASFRISWV
jgi:hypothetical protein